MAIETSNIRLETLWVLLNLSFCCLEGKETNYLTNELLKFDHLRDLLIDSITLSDYTASMELTLEDYQKLDMGLTLVGNLISSSCSFELLIRLEPDLRLFTNLEKLIPKVTESQTDILDSI